jgi:hypothetical protein
VWLSKDIHGFDIPTASQSISQPPAIRASKMFADALAFAKTGGGSSGNSHPAIVAMDMSAACSNVGGAAQTSSGPQGLRTDELLEIAIVAGADTNVICFQIADFHPDSEDVRGNLLLTELLYHFSLGVASRPHMMSLPLTSASLQATSVASSIDELVSYAAYANGNRSASSSPVQNAVVADNRLSLRAPLQQPLLAAHLSNMNSGFDGMHDTLTGERSARTSVRLSLTSAESGFSAPNSRPNSLSFASPYVQFPSASPATGERQYSMKLDSFGGAFADFGISYPHQQQPQQIERRRSSPVHLLEAEDPLDSLLFPVAQQFKQKRSVAMSNSGSEHKALFRTHSNLSVASDCAQFDETTGLLHYSSPPTLGQGQGLQGQSVGRYPSESGFTTEWENRPLSLWKR